MDKKQKIIEALRVFMSQRSGIEFGNYGDVKAFRAEQRSITKDLHHARELLRYVELRDSITADDLLRAARDAFSGRLTIVEREDGAVGVDYCTGQYFPTEYRWQVIENARGIFKHGIGTANAAPISAMIAYIDIKSVATDKPSRLANARLIAAAPDLLDACMTLIMRGDLQATIDKAIAAIAKATQE